MPRESIPKTEMDVVLQLLILFRVAKMMEGKTNKCSSCVDPGLSAWAKGMVRISSYGYWLLRVLEGGVSSVVQKYLRVSVFLTKYCPVLNILMLPCETRTGRRLGRSPG